jgi:ribosomal protein S18 acetylase RimI-like enzyme
VLSRPPPPLIRPYRFSDRAELIRVGTEVFAPFGDYEHVLGSWLDTAGVRVFVAERDGEFCGATIYALMRLPDGDGLFCELLAVQVAVPHQHTGVGRALLSTTVEHQAELARRYGVHCTRLSTADDNEPAHALFREFGFVATDEPAGVYAGGQRILRMERPLP